MPRPKPETDEAPGYDSFLDIVANMVGMLIILVVIVGVRVKNAPAPAIVEQAAREDPELAKQEVAAVSLRADVFRIEEQKETVEAETVEHRRYRDLLAVAVSIAEHKIQSRREQLDAESRRDFDLQRDLAEGRRRLEQLDRERQAAAGAKDAPVEVKCYPTPLSKTVDAKEAHFQLRGGRLVYVPLNELLDEMVGEFHRKKYKLRYQTEYVDAIGPVEGFRLKYILGRFDVTPEMAADIGMAGQIIRLMRCEFIPVADDLGETTDRALASNSDFRARLQRLRPGQNTITVWVYEDSFNEFRRIKKELFQLGFACAGRPLQKGEYISGSPEGSKSAAQ